MIQVKTTETRVEDFVPSSKALATTSITVEMQVRQWEIAATMLAEIAARATSQVLVANAIITGVAWPPDL